MKVKNDGTPPIRGGYARDAVRHLNENAAYKHTVKPGDTVTAFAKTDLGIDLKAKLKPEQQRQVNDRVKAYATLNKELNINELVTGDEVLKPPLADRYGGEGNKPPSAPPKGWGGEGNKPPPATEKGWGGEGNKPPPAVTEKRQVKNLRAVPKGAAAKAAKVAKRFKELEASLEKFTASASSVQQRTPEERLAAGRILMNQIQADAPALLKTQAGKVLSEFASVVQFE